MAFRTPESMDDARSMLRRIRKGAAKLAAERADALRHGYTIGVRAVDERARLADYPGAEAFVLAWMEKHAPLRGAKKKAEKMPVMGKLYGSNDLIEKAAPIRERLVRGAVTRGVPAPVLAYVLREQLFHANPWLDGSAKRVLDGLGATRVKARRSS